LKPGDEFHHRGQLLEHQNMESISYGDCTFDYVLHCDVLEHVNDPIKAIKENIRVHKKGGIALFTTPVYTGQRGSITTAVLDRNNRVIFHGEELYHGDPLKSEGVPVFTLFGLDFIEELQSIGINCSYLIEHSILQGVFSNNNPYDVGHMWPIVIKIQKQ
jgi:SAM-dependent methyltransferase